MKYGDALPEKFDPPPKDYKLDNNDGKGRKGMKASSANWIADEARVRSIRRDIAVAKETISDMKKRELNTQREMKQFRRNDFEKAVELEDLQVKKKIPCGCCYQLFSDVNLPLKVSNKAVVDMRKKFANEDKEVDPAFFIRNVPPSKGKGWWLKIDYKLSNLSRCYDDVSVCVFCAQFFKDQDSYRPSFETVYYEDRKRAYFEQKALERAHWDPLASSEAHKIETERIELEMKAAAAITNNAAASQQNASADGISDDDETEGKGK